MWLRPSTSKIFVATEITALSAGISGEWVVYEVEALAVGEH